MSRRSGLAPRPTCSTPPAAAVPAFRPAPGGGRFFATGRSTGSLPATPPVQRRSRRGAALRAGRAAPRRPAPSSPQASFPVAPAVHVLVELLRVAAALGHRRHG